MKKKPNVGQTWISNVERDVEAEALRSGRPQGMPPFDQIQTEAKRMGLTDNDALWANDMWLANGYRTRYGKIKDWKAALRLYYRKSWFPSQKEKPPGLLRHEREKPAQLAEAAKDRVEADEARRRLGEIKKQIKGS